MAVTQIWDEEHDKQALQARVLELFAGIVGCKFAADKFHTAEAKNKFTIAVERDAEVIKTYKANHRGLVLNTLQLRKYFKTTPGSSRKTSPFTGALKTCIGPHAQ